MTSPWVPGQGCEWVPGAGLLGFPFPGYQGTQVVGTSSVGNGRGPEPVLAAF